MSESVFVARLWHESNTNVSDETTREDFRNRNELYGDDIPATFGGTNSDIGGIMEVAQDADVDVHYSVVAEAEPGGPVTESAYRYFSECIVEAAADHADTVDGVILPLHGAMVPEHLDDGEGPLISKVRAVIGPDVPIVVTIDPNANVSAEMVDASDAIVAYETTPHVDRRETGRTGMQLLLRAMQGLIEPVMHIERPPVLPSAVCSTTLETPMADIAKRARALEEQEDVLKVNVCQGFWSADVPYMGFSIVAVSDGTPDTARTIARDVSRLVWSRRHDFVEETVSADEAVRRARELAADQGRDEGPVVLAEMHDNPGGGKPADGTKVLRGLLDRGVSNAGLAIIRDPDAVTECVDAGIGRDVTLTIGGKTEDQELYGRPVEAVSGYVKAITDGRYANTGPMKTGVENNMGRTVLLHCDDGRVAVILTENRVQPLDAEVWRHVGIQPERLDVIAVKSAVHYRADYSRIASEIISVDESPPNEYHRIDGPRYPIDEMADDDYPDWDDSV